MDVVFVLAQLLDDVTSKLRFQLTHSLQQAWRSTHQRARQRGQGASTLSPTLASSAMVTRVEAHASVAIA